MKLIVGFVEIFTENNVPIVKSTRTYVSYLKESH